MNTYHHRLFVVSALVAAATCGGVPAYAQAPGSGRPFSRLFGGTATTRDSGQALNLTLSLAEAYNDDTTPELGNVIDPSAGQASGFQTMLVANTNYSWQGSRGQFVANTSSSLAYYNELRKTRNISHTAAVGFSARLSAQSSLLINQTASYSPSYLYGLFPSDSTLEPGDSPPAAPDYSLQTLTRETYSYDTSMALNHNLTRRNRLSVSGDFHYTDYLHESDTQRDMKVAGARGQFSRNVTRNSALSFGYRYRHGQVGLGLEPTAEHGLDVGVQHSRPLSATRRASVGFRLGASTVELPLSAQQQLSAVGRRYLVDGEFSLGYQFSRMWQARAMYRRGVEYVAALTEPVFTDGFSANVEAALTRRFDLQASAGYSNGKSVFAPDSSALETYTGDVRLRYALNRKLAGYVQYMYYFYDFSGNTQLASGLPPQLERNAVRAGIMLWLPAFQR